MMSVAAPVFWALWLSGVTIQGIESDVGMTGSGAPILCEFDAAWLDWMGDRKRLLVLGGMDGSTESAYAVRRMQEWFVESREALPFRRQFSLATVPLANPDGVRLQFPPSGEAYRQMTESHYLWRWIQLQAPDYLLIVGPDSGSLAAALDSDAAQITGRIPSERIGESEEALRQFLERRAGSIEFSPARREVRQRLARTPQQVAEQLAQVYGRQLPEVVYIPAVALMARLRLGAVEDVERIVEPFVSGGKDSLHQPTGSHLSGHLIFAWLYERTKRPEYLDLVKKAASLGFTETGEMRECMPFHNEMSDAVFMGCPILAAAGRHSGEQKYFEMAMRHFAFIQKLNQRSDGLYRHSPLDETAWGRGNGFPALGLALTLSDMPPSYPGRSKLLQEFRKHMVALAKYQTGGMWRQVVDQHGAWRELSATCMIAFAMQRGIRRGWLPRRSFQPLVDQAWEAVKIRTSADGKLVDVCASTGKQRSLRDYLDRPAVFGEDPRGGAMVMLLATELK
ncbi:MAG: glycoside hydrolase family 88 protein [Bryobacteraceae bacterium]|nr:glycoside hydrolase family 88 protein [Bryobacteraceae bacterium]MDW8379964.1 glycoside hydrolase family 88 protein [Bryobacterales bacterium]